MSEEEYESPYCEVCGTCGYIGCCGIRNFISEHIEGKTNCKNENLIISELINLCEYETEVFKKNKQLQSQLQEKEKIIEDAIEYIKTCNPDVDLNSMFLNESYISNYGAKELLSILERK